MNDDDITDGSPSNPLLPNATSTTAVVWAFLDAHPRKRAAITPEMQVLFDVGIVAGALILVAAVMCACRWYRAKRADEANPLLGLHRDSKTGFSVEYSAVSEDDTRG